MRTRRESPTVPSQTLSHKAAVQEARKVAKRTKAPCYVLTAGCWWRWIATEIPAGHTGTVTTVTSDRARQIQAIPEA